MRNHPTAKSTEMVKPKMGQKDMNKTGIRRTEQREATNIERMCQELGDDAIHSLYKAYRVTAAAIPKSANKRAHWTVEPDECREASNLDGRTRFSRPAVQLSTRNTRRKAATLQHAVNS